MRPVLLSFAAALAACTPSAEEAAAMRSPSSASDPDAEATAGGSGGAAPPGQAPAPVQDARSPDTPAAQGRRILSTAFVRVGPDGLLTVQRRDGRELVLRNVMMGAAKYCGAVVAGSPGGGEYCGGYEEVAAARPGAPAEPPPPDMAGPNPVAAPRT